MSKKVLITGGSRGIGAVCVRKFASAGYSVAFVYNKSRDAVEKLSRETGAHAICADISAADEAKRAVTEAIEAIGGIDVLVNNAGIAHIGLFGEFSYIWCNIRIILHLV